MPEILLQQKVFPYTGSLDSTRHPLLISPQDVVDLNNIIYTTYSTKKLRPGISAVFDNKRPSGSTRIVGAIDYWRNGTQYFVYVQGERVKVLNEDGTIDDITGSLEVPNDEAVSFVRIQGLLIIFFTGGETLPHKWTGSGPLTPLSDDCPYSTMGRVMLNCLFLDDPSVPGRILKSVTGDVTNFTDTDASQFDFDINDGDPDGISAIFPPFMGSLIVSKRFSLHALTPNFTSAGDIYWSYKPIYTDGIGCNSHNSAVTVEGMLFFTSDNGVHYMQNTDKLSGVESDYLSAKIQTIWTGNVNFARSKYIKAVYDVNLASYLLVYPRLSANFSDSLFGYSIRANDWYKWDDYGQSTIARRIDKDTRKVKTVVCSNSGDIGYIDEDVNTDHGERFSCSIYSGIIAPSGTPDDAFIFKFIAPIFVPQVTGVFSLTYYINGIFQETIEIDMTSTEVSDPLGEGFTLGRSARLGGVPSVKMDKVAIGGNGLFYSWAIEYQPDNNSDADEGFELLGVLVDVDRSTKIVGEAVS